MKRRFVIVSKVRFATFLMILTLVLMLIASGFISKATAQTYDGALMQVQVQENDTLWGLSQRYVDETVDMRKYILKVCEINEIKAGDIKEGDLLLFPILDSEEI